MKKVLLYSGGMDSWLINKLWKPDIRLYINIEGTYSKSEVERLPNDVKVVKFPLLGEFEQPDRFIPLRNLYFLMIASHYGNDLCLGATAGDGSKDKSVPFLEGMDALLKYFWDDKKAKKPIHVETTFATMSKGELLREYLAGGGNLETVKKETFSCYEPIDEKECLSCYPCFRKYAVLHSNGLEYPEDEERKIWEYVKNSVIPTRGEGGYDGTYYTDRGEESKELIAAVEYLKGRYS